MQCGIEQSETWVVVANEMLRVRIRMVCVCVCMKFYFVFVL